MEAVGKDVTQFQPGDEVFGTCDGSFAQFALARPDKLAPKPANLTFEQAATVPSTGSTALQALRDVGRVQQGHEVLVIGAAGGVGTCAVQIAKAFGAHVTGLCSTTKVDLVRAIGADDVIDYTRGGFAAAEERYDLILDIAGNRSVSHLRRALAPRGTMVIVGGEGGGRWFGGIDRQLRAHTLSPFVSQKLGTFISKAKGDDLVVLKELIEAGKVTPVIDRTYPLAEVPDAIRYVHEGHTRGKVVVTVVSTFAADARSSARGTTDHGTAGDRAETAHPFLRSEGSTAWRRRIPVRGFGPCSGSSSTTSHLSRSIAIGESPRRSSSIRTSPSNAPDASKFSALTTSPARSGLPRGANPTVPTRSIGGRATPGPRTLARRTWARRAAKVERHPYAPRPEAEPSEERRFAGDAGGRQWPAHQTTGRELEKRTRRQSPSARVLLLFQRHRYYPGSAPVPESTHASVKRVSGTPLRPSRTSAPANEATLDEPRDCERSYEEPLAQEPGRRARSRP
ncbi:hypothetical protein BH20ACT24_BH20ACT24_10240 [soil metagenome]